MIILPDPSRLRKNVQGVFSFQTKLLRIYACEYVHRHTYLYTIYMFDRAYRGVSKDGFQLSWLECGAIAKGYQNQAWYLYGLVATSVVVIVLIWITFESKVIIARVSSVMPSLFFIAFSLKV